MHIYREDLLHFYRLIARTNILTFFLFCPENSLSLFLKMSLSLSLSFSLSPSHTLCISLFFPHSPSLSYCVDKGVNFLFSIEPILTSVLLRGVSLAVVHFEVVYAILLLPLSCQASSPAPPTDLRC